MTVFKSQIQRIHAEPGYILHIRPYRETSAILDVFTKNHGRIHLVGRGLRKSSSKKNRPPELFTKYEFAFVSSHSELYTLTGMEVVNDCAHLFSPYQLCCCLYLNELLLRVLQREDAHHEVFVDYQTVLQNIYQRSHESIEINLRLFEKKLLQNLGYGICFNNIKAEEFYIFQSSKGFVKVLRDTKDSISGKGLKAFANDEVLIEDRRAIKKMMRETLLPLIGDRPLKTRELF